MTIEKKTNLFLENLKDETLYKKNKLKLTIQFNRVAFIFFIFFIISIIYSIHLIHLGSRNVEIQGFKNKNLISKLFRADIVDRNGF